MPTISKRELLALAACYLVFSIMFGIRYTYSLLTVEMMNDLKFSNQEIGLMLSSFLLSYFPMGLVIGRLTDKKGAKISILAVLPLLGLGSILIGAATSSVINGILFSVIAGIGASAAYSPVMVWSQKLHPERRGFVVGLVESGSKIAPFFIALAIPLMVPVIGWRGVWILLGAVTLFLLPLVIKAFEPMVEDNNRGKATYLEDIRSIMRNKIIWIVGVSYALSAFSIMLHVAFYKAYLVRELMINIDISSLLYGLMQIAGFIGAIVLPILSDKVGRKPLIMATNIILILSLLGFLFSRSIISIILFSILIGIDLGAKWPLYIAFVKDIYEWSVAGLATAFLGLFAGMGSILAPYISGLLADLYGSYRISYILGIFTGATAAALIEITK